MKILQIIDSLEIGGAEVLVVDLSVYLSKQGHDVTILSLKRTESFLTQKVYKNNIRFISFDSSNVYNPFLAFKIARLLKREKFDILHVHLFPAQYWLALNKKYFGRKLKVITTEHSTSNKRRSNILLRSIDRYLYKSFDKIITVSDKAQENLLKHLGYDTNKLVTINNGIDVHCFFSSEPFDRSLFALSDNDIIIIMVARFIYPKDQNTVIKSMMQLPENSYLFLVGDGIEKNCSEQLVRDLGLESRVRFLGVRDDVPKLLKMSDIVVMSSQYEGLSLSSVEGMSVGKPFISSNVDGLKEIVGGYGLLFDYGDENQLADCVKLCISSEEEYTKIAKSCLKRAQDFDVNLMVKKHLEIYNNIVK